MSDKTSKARKKRSRLVRRVLVEVTASPQEAGAVEGVFGRAGFRVKAEAEIPPSGGPPVPMDWMLQVTLAVPIAAFFAAFASAAGKDAYAAFRDWLKDLQTTRRGNGRVTIWDKDDTILALPDGPIPEEALGALEATDWASLKGGYIEWDRERREWRSVG